MLRGEGIFFYNLDLGILSIYGHREMMLGGEN